MRLARPIRPDDPEPLAEPHLGVERFDDPLDREAARADDHLPGSATAEAHLHVLDRGLLGGLLARLEPLEPMFGRSRLGGPAVVVGGLALHLLHHLAEPVALVLVPAVALVQALDPSISRFGVGREAADVGPRCPPLQGHDPGRRPVQDRPVVRDEQDRPGVLRDHRLEPSLALDVEGVVRLVQHEYVEGRCEDDLQGEPLALAAGKRVDQPLGALRIAAPERRLCAAVPQDLGPVPSRMLPRCERRGVPQLSLLVRFHRQPLLRSTHLRRGRSHFLLAVGE